MKNHNEYNGGIADCWYDGPRADLWIEYKFIEIPKRDGTLIDLVGGKDPTLSDLQQKWLADRAANRRRVAVIVGCKEGGVWYMPFEWRIACTARDFRGFLKPRAWIAQQIAEITVG